MQWYSKTHKFILAFPWLYTGIEQLTTGWTTKGSEFESRQRQEFSLLYVVQTGSGVHLTSYPMGTGGSFPGGKAAGA
jgi:hypothetical protein